MIPDYRYMDSHPFQKNQTPYQYPNMEHIPSYMTMDPARTYMPPTDSGCNTWYSGYPMPIYSCCNGGNFSPGCYGFKPPHLPIPPHQHMHCYGRYPSCPEPYYIPYVPPPHYNVEQPRYEFDKNMMMRNHHCCGCPNRPNSLCGQNQNPNGGKCVRIEEEKPDVQRKGSLVPVQLGDNQCPIVWIPPDYMGREKERAPSETATVKQEKEHHGSNSTEKGPKFWSGWPLSDLSRLESWLPDVEGMGEQTVQNKQQEDGKKELSFPVIWMPARKDAQNMYAAPMKPIAEPSTIESPEVVKTINQRNTPETDMDHKTKDTKEIKERRCIPIPVVTVKDNVENESSRNNVKRQSSSSPKKSRLPPVCLRVDPLPKKKHSNDGSKSPSSVTPTAAKGNSQLDSKIDNATVEHGSEKIIKTAEVRTHESPDGNQEKEIISSTGELLSSPRRSKEKFVDKTCKDGTEESTGKEDERISDTDTSTEVVNEGLEISSEDLEPDEGKKEKPNMSDVEAAVLIQSAYRGYEVRKWELLKKMKQLVEVRQQIIEVQNRVKALGLVPQDEKERIFTGEMIMRLLLKLDTIQGLHPSVREFRKSLAKELISLQERLDCMAMTTKHSEEVQEATPEKPAEPFDVETHDDRKENEQDEVDIVAIGKIFSESNSLLGESDEAQPLHRTDNMDGFEGAKSSPADVSDENSKACEAEQVVELREPGVKNEDTSEMSSQNFSKQFEGEKVASLLIGDKKPEEAESTAEMEQNVEMVTDDVLKMDMEGQTDDYQATISVPEDHLTADEEVPMREDDNPSNFEAAKLEHIETREVSEAEQNEERSSHTKCENGNGVIDESTELRGEQSNSTGNVNIQIESAIADEEKMVGEVQHQTKQPSEESADSVEERLNSYHDKNIENDVVIEKVAEEMDKKLVEENEKMKEMVEKLMEAGKEQIATISKLSGRVKELEKRLARKRKLRGGCGKSVSRQHPMLNGRIKT